MYVICATVTLALLTRSPNPFEPRATVTCLASFIQNLVSARYHALAAVTPPASASVRGTSEKPMGRAGDSCYCCCRSYHLCRQGWRVCPTGGAVALRALGRWGGGGSHSKGYHCVAAGAGGEVFPRRRAGHHGERLVRRQGVPTPGDGCCDSGAVILFFPTVDIGVPMKNCGEGVPTPGEGCRVGRRDLSPSPLAAFS